MYTVALETSRSWLVDATAPGTGAVICGTRMTSGGSDTLDGTFRVYAGGLTQFESGDEDAQVLPLTLVHMSWDDKEQVKAWRGRVVLLRTTDGLRLYCVYTATTWRRVMRTTPDDGSDTVTYDVDVVFNRVSFDESV